MFIRNILITIALPFSISYISLKIWNAHNKIAPLSTIDTPPHPPKRGIFSYRFSFTVLFAFRAEHNALIWSYTVIETWKTNSRPAIGNAIRV